MTNLKDILQNIQKERDNLKQRKEKIQQILDIVEDRLKKELANSVNSKDFRALKHTKLSYTIVELVKSYIQASQLDANISKDLISSYEKEVELFLKWKKQVEEDDQEKVDMKLIQEIEKQIEKNIKLKIGSLIKSSSD